MILEIDAFLVDFNRKGLPTRKYLSLEDSEGARITDVYYDQVNIFEWDGCRYFVETPFSSPDGQYHMHRIDASMTLTTLKPAQRPVRERVAPPESDELIDRIYYSTKSEPTIVEVRLLEGKTLKESMIREVTRLLMLAQRRGFRIRSTFRSNVLKVWRRKEGGMAS